MPGRLFRSLRMVNCVRYGLICVVVLLGGLGCTPDKEKLDAKPAAAAKPKPMQLTIRFETSTTAGRFSPRNVHAVWVQTKAGNFVRTLDLWGERHAKQLTDFKAAVGDLAAAVQARTGATEKAYGAYTSRWNLMDAAGNRVPDGDYVVQFELTSDNADKNKRHRASVPFTKNGTPATIELAEMGGYKNIVLDYQVVAAAE